jgi:hypothetical protein
MAKPNLSSAARALGRKGGKVGGRTTGKTKRRGGSAYYRRLARLRRRLRFCEVCGGELGVMTFEAFEAMGRACAKHDEPG